MVHGSNGSAPIALKTYSNLYKKFQVYAIAVLAPSNKCSDKRLFIHIVVKFCGSMSSCID
jgi:hypothetical protein